MQGFTTTLIYDLFISIVINWIMSTSTSTSAPTTVPVNGSSSQSPHPLLENNDEKNRFVGLFLTTILYRMSNCHPKSVVIKVGMVGDSQIGKTSLMVKYVEGSFDEDYIQTLGKSLRNNQLFQ